MSNLCIVYVSEGMRSSVVSQLRHVAAAQKVRFAHSFQDTVYNRTSFYFVGEDVKSSVLSFCTEAFRAVDYSQHHGTHPALGSIDHICFSPLAGKPLEETKELAEDFGKTFAEYFDTPVFAYGAASSTQKRLRDIRKSLGYFDIVPESNQGTQIIEKLNSLVKANDLNNDYGSPIVDPAKGVTCIGAVPFVLNYNVRFRPTDTKKVVSKITAHVREPLVECLTLVNEGGCPETTCNLLNWREVGPEVILQKCTEKAKELGAEVTYHYTTSPGEMDLLERVYTPEP